MDYRRRIRALEKKLGMGSDEEVVEFMGLKMTKKQWSAIWDEATGKTNAASRMMAQDSRETV